MHRTRSRRRSRVKTRRVPRAERLIRMLVSGCDNPASMLELYYWSREPGLVEVIRAIVSMPEDTRAAFEAFVALARDAKSIEARLDPHGALTLASPEIVKTIALARYAAENDNEEGLRLLN